MLKTFHIPRTKTAVGAVLLFVAVNILVYGNSLSNEFVSWDDQSLIVENPIVAQMNARTVSAAFSSFDPELYIPLTFVSYQLDHLVGGTNPFVYHLHNLVLHVFNSLLVAWLIWILIGNGWIALLAGLLFAVHPINTEAVAWASARKDVLSAFFFFAALLSWLGWKTNRDKKLYALSVLLFLLGLLSKVSILMLPVALLLLDLCFYEEKPTIRLLKNKIPFIFLSAIFGFIALYGKQANLVQSTLFEKFLMAARSTVFYPGKIFVPAGLSPLYPYNGMISFAVPAFYLSFLAVVLGLIFAIFIRKRNRHLSFGLLFFFLTLIPSFFNYYKGGNVYVASDRYVYIPLIGFIVIFAAVIRDWLHSADSFKILKSRKIILTSVSILVLSASSVASARQAAIWSDNETLYGHVLDFYPEAGGAHNNLGMEYLAQRRLDEAVEKFQEALSIQPDPRVNSNLAAAYFQKGEFDKSYAEYLKVLKFGPDLPDGYYGIGNIYEKQGKLEEAADYYRKALGIDPKYVNALNNLGGVLIRLKRWPDAIATLEKSLELKPDFTESYYNLGGAYLRDGNFEKAIENLDMALELKPDDPDALANLAEAWYGKKDIDKTAKYLKKSLYLQPGNPMAMDLLFRMKRDGYVK